MRQWHVVAITGLIAIPLRAATLYVAPGGDDRAAGTPDHPLATIERARDRLRAQSADAERVVELAAGTYRLTRTLTFGAQDSGTPAHPVVYRAAPGATVVLSGGRLVTGWTADAEGRWRASVDLPDFRQLWVNGVRAPRARGAVPAGLKPWGEQQAVVHPSAAPRPPGTTGTPGYRVGTIEVSGAAGYTTSDARLATWRHPEDVELGYDNSWTHMIAKVARIVPDGGGARIEMAQPGFFLCGHKSGTQIGAPAYLENAFELLKTPGQWYFDRTAHTLYYLPRPGEDMTKAEVVAPALTTLVDIRGSLDQPVHDLRFEGLTFSHATWLRPSEIGHPDVQANFIQGLDNSYLRPEGNTYATANGEYLKSPANVVVDAAQAVQFTGCVFRALGGAGLDVQDGAQNNVVERCRFEDISGSGLQIGDVTREDHHPSDPRRTVKGNRVSDCVITRIGVEYSDAIGVFCGYTDGTVISHNEIFDIPYTAISVGWGWGEPDAGGGGYVSPVIWPTPTVCRDNRIEFNHLHDLMRLRNDGGGIYTLSRQPGTIIRGNHIHDAGPGQPGGIYLDEGSADIEVADNVVYAVGNPMNFNNGAQNRRATCKVHDNHFGRLRTTDGMVGRALAGGSGGVDMELKPRPDLSRFTIEAWIRLAQYRTGPDARDWVACMAGNEWVDGNLSLFIDGKTVSGYLNIGGGNGGNWFRADGKGEPLKLGVWTPVALTYDGEWLRAWCDGAQTAECHVGRAYQPPNTPLTLAGRQDRFRDFPGDLDEVRLYTRALSPAELAANIAAVRGGGTVGAEGLAGHWGFEAAADAVADKIVAEAGPTPR